MVTEPELKNSRQSLIMFIELKLHDPSLSYFFNSLDMLWCMAHANPYRIGGPMSLVGDILN